MMPPTSIDGTDITGATIDGTDVQEITVDGQTVFSAGGGILPQAGLQHRYDATQLSLNDGDPVNTWPDSAGTEDASAVNAPTYRNTGIGGLPSVEFVDSANEHLQVNFASTISQPLEYFSVINLNDNNFAQDFVDGFSQNVRTRFNYGTGEMALLAGTPLVFSFNPPNSPTIATSIFDGANSELRLNGTSIFTGNAGSNGMDGIHIGTRLGSTNTSIDGLIGEILIYDASASGFDRSGVESFLSGKWGITI